MTSDESRSHDILVRQLGVSRETLDQLDHFVRLLRIWQKSINLVSAATLENVWMRHVVDSAQIMAHVPATSRKFLDLGSGAGFPGLVLAIMKQGASSESSFTLIESSGKKTAFLQKVVQELSLGNVSISNTRIEDAITNLRVADVITARALASMTDLIGFVDPLLKTGAIALFPKGRDAEQELTIARQHWHFSSTSYPSITDPGARIIKLWV